MDKGDKLGSALLDACMEALEDGIYLLRAGARGRSRPHRRSAQGRNTKVRGSGSQDGDQVQGP